MTTLVKQEENSPWEVTAGIFKDIKKASRIELFQSSEGVGFQKKESEIETKQKNTKNSINQMRF